MGVLVDTSVWIGLFSNAPTPQVSALEKLIEAREDLCVCSLIVAEVLQGIRNDHEVARTRHVLDQLLYLEIQRTTFELAAGISRDLRRNGLTIRNSVDCIKCHPVAA